MSPIWSVVFMAAVLHVTGTQALNCIGYKMIRKGQLTCQDKKIIIDEHNRLRQKIALGQVTGQPKAANMMEVVWDDELANTAQRWANLCSEDHDTSRHVTRFSVGQNLARSWTTKAPSAKADTNPDFIRSIDGWFNEVANYKVNGVNSGTGHYTQVIWSTTWAVGCGYSYYWDPSKGYTKNYVCNYGPAGNVRGIQPYNSGGQSCTRWGMTASRLHSGLCSVKGTRFPLGLACMWYGKKSTDVHFPLFARGN